jgi:hypothetical protein
MLLGRNRRWIFIRRRSESRNILYFGAANKQPRERQTNKET